MKNQRTQGRSCGGCNECCKVFAVSTFNKGAGEMCKHCDVGVGCKIYETRPRGCKWFECRWLEGFGTDEDRPDKSGVVVDDIANPGFLGNPMIRITEVRSGALQEPYAQELTNELIAKFVAVMHVAVGSENPTIVLRRDMSIPALTAEYLKTGAQLVRWEVPSAA